ncbi:hypothetical protein K503DRAFT_780774 [Rhizopogon vinicolor AM-OR11-026]|uniref:Uncharacterized protein n=1 Tax=Rhizopogon vinicolor AM-OR11-026 TaxID=1314800 RepID=A0A1B7N8U0_9AGAM|nr:hypothetical protein K503DRAFT_780774 [Rhizopogon vinicolor AM-OR11-026]
MKFTASSFLLAALALPAFAQQTANITCFRNHVVWDMLGDYVNGSMANSVYVPTVDSAPIKADPRALTYCAFYALAGGGTPGVPSTVTARVQQVDASFCGM